LLLINTAVFVALCVKTRTVFMPSVAGLLAFGAKDPVRLAHGELWRLFTPIFLHVGLIHYAVNSYALYIVGYQLERILGGPWFMATYLAAGTLGNISSGVFSVNMSAGASGAIFGLLGAGLLIERKVGRQIQATTGQNPRRRAYLMTVLLNLAFGFLVPFIDNSAHLGGLVAGLLLTLAMLSLRPNRLQRPSRSLGIALIAITLLLAGVGTYLASSPAYLLPRLEAAGDKASEADQQVYHYSQALSVDPADAPVRLKRARALLLAGEAKYGLYDAQRLLSQGGHELEIASLAAEVEAKGHAPEANALRTLMAMKPQSPTPPPDEDSSLDEL